MARTTATVIFQALELKGSLLPASLLEEVSKFNRPKELLPDPHDYGLSRGERLRDRIDAAWVLTKELWEDNGNLKERAGGSTAGLHFALRLLRGLGRSALAQRYGLHGLGEAKAYLADPLLRQRLEQVIDVIHHQLQQPDQTLEHLMGGELDATKTISSHTLFEAAGLASATTLLNQLGRRCVSSSEPGL